MVVWEGLGGNSHGNRLPYYGSFVTSPLLCYDGQTEKRKSHPVTLM
ncbi:hypothetical protein SACS_0100 [Parasaccharibacter apium]|uniref:Uncharacterized protein n=1 Tax=Parasaccharibacter apium TaxID=1510841 RepID=A0A7U7G476_9PROT|nr:hypothetical protein SACS_0100 [Parasaccharibacter apium]